MEWIRNAYNVPAKLGGRVKFKGKPGTILGTQGQYLTIQLDGEKTKGPYHPTWEMEYLAEEQKGLRGNYDKENNRQNATR